LGEWKSFESNDSQFKGCIQGVDENGKLIVQTEKEGINMYDLKEIRYIDI